MREVKKYSDEWFNELYLKYGSVEEAIRRYEESLPISAANYHRLVAKYGLVKSAGRHVSLPETLHFFRLKAMQPGTPLERLYTQMPASFQTSLSTLHRIYQFMEKAVVRRYAAALIIKGEGKQVLFGREVFGNSRYGKNAGDFSIPMGFAKKDESNLDSALRVLQQEVFSGLAAQGRLKGKSDIVCRILPLNIEPFLCFDIVDVRVKVFEVDVPKELYGEFASYKLVDHRFMSPAEACELPNLRAGVGEILGIYGYYLNNSYTVEFPVRSTSMINLLALAQAKML